MITKILRYIMLIFLLIVLAFFIMSFLEHKENYICFSKECFEVEIADTDEKRQKGLMFRKELDKGMLFIFEKQDYHSFWMKNTLIPLDIIWINENLEIIHIEHAIPCRKDPCISYRPQYKAKYVAEFPKGFAEKMNIKLSDKIFII